MHEVVSSLSWLQFAFGMVIVLYLLVPTILVGYILLRLLRIWRHRGALFGIGSGLDFPWDEPNTHRHVWQRPEGEMSQLFAQSQEQAELINLTDSHMEGL